MELSRCHWVGLFSGIPLFSGAWLSAYYNNIWPGLIGLVVAGIGIFIAVRVESREDRLIHIKRGVIAGLLAAIIARLLGAISSWMVGLKQGTSPLESLADMWRVTLNGTLAATITFVVLIALLGLAISLLEPEAKEPATKVTRKTAKGKK
jgi:hypothetical protein